MRNLWERLSRNRQGFTLIEMLVVVTIIGLLTAFAMPRLYEAFRKARMAPGQADMKTIPAAVERYFIDNNAYPGGMTADEIMSALRGGYLRSSTTFRNGFKQGYLYLTSDSGLGYLLIDLQGQSHDHGVGAGQQITVTCTDGMTDEIRTWTVVTGDTAGLVLPAVGAGGNWTVPDSHINSCTVGAPNQGIAAVTH